ncbi:MULTISPECIES: mercuric transporter MerT family protein [unclassified Bradyrhizobium]|jgi:mercuric ion transport protein|uniref:mercuric transporter MerT family protein n=1 Tax=unclassified Bradyrhizobium TaxID=2631580 RepID=UPI0007102911|nr:MULTISPECIES: mercuric transporter MerT family protein [unclassified Bradyrhizobium]KQT20750.1 mercury transporter MerT [Bradyrhizobium sp. Leaf396]
MVPSRAGTKEAVPTASGRVEHELGRQRLVAFGGIIGALAASSCCIVPLVLFSLGIGGAWISRLTVLAPYKPLFIAATAGMLGYGFYVVYWKSGQACADGTACTRPVSTRIVRLSLWMATLIVLAAFGFDYVAPLLLGT